MTRYRLLALDMDGTLLTSDKRISERTLAAIRGASERGVAVALSTGRAYAELMDYPRQLQGAVRYGSLSSGACVYDFEGQRPIAATTFATATAQAIVSLGRELGVMAHAMSLTESLATRTDVEHMASFGMGIYQGMFRRVCTFVPDLCEAVATRPGEICKVNLYCHDGDERERVLRDLPALDAQVARAETTSLEFSPAGVSKASGLELLCRNLGCTLADCIAVGDSFNDLDALRVAGLSVVMGNSPDEVKRQADAVVADNDHDGIADVVERFLG